MGSSCGVQGARRRARTILFHLHKPLGSINRSIAAGSRSAVDCDGKVGGKTYLEFSDFMSVNMSKHISANNLNVCIK